MDLEEIKNLLVCKDKEKLIDLILLLLSKHSYPVFGAAKQIEHEIAAIEVLKQIGYLQQQSDEYDYIHKLKITKAKARNLMYQESLRNEQLDIREEIRKALQNPTIQKDGKGMYSVEIVNPLVMDGMRKIVRDLGYISDGSFSGSIAKISQEALLSLVDNLIDDKEEVMKSLREQGFPDTSFKAFVKTALVKMSTKIADDTGEAIVENIGDGLAKIFEKNFDFIKTIMSEAR